MRVELKAMQRRAGITFLLVTHDQEEALSMSDQLAVMNEGRIEQIGTPEEIYLRPATRFVAGFLGAVNWIGDVGVRPEATRICAQPGRPWRPLRAGAGDRLSVPGRLLSGLVRLESGEEAVAQVPATLATFLPGEPSTSAGIPPTKFSFHEAALLVSAARMALDGGAVRGAARDRAGL